MQVRNCFSADGEQKFPSHLHRSTWTERCETRRVLLLRDGGG
jgi:hypothetical protein